MPIRSVDVPEGKTKSQSIVKRPGDHRQPRRCKKPNELQLILESAFLRRPRKPL
jgi:hypothetical protein